MNKTDRSVLYVPLFLGTERLRVLITGCNNRLRKKEHSILSKFHAHNSQSMERATGIRNLCQWACNVTSAAARSLKSAVVHDQHFCRHAHRHLEPQKVTQAPHQERVSRIKQGLSDFM